MERQFARRRVRTVLVAAIGVLAAGCGGSTSNPATPGPGAPVISNLVASFLAQACTTAQMQAGTVLSVTVSYADAEGDVRGGRLQTTGTFAPSGVSGSLDFALPSGAASFTGTTAGTIQVLPCVHFGSDATFNLAVAVVDSAGNPSSTLLARLDKPAGAPEAPRGGKGWAAEVTRADRPGQR